MPNNGAAAVGVPAPAPGADAAAPADPVTRHRDAAPPRLLAAGAGGFSLQEVAALAGVSKGLIHYHFATKERLLARTVEWIGVGMEARLAAAAAGSAPAAGIDALWAALSAELGLGHLRLLGELAHDASADVRGTVARVLRARRRALGTRIEAVFAGLGLQARVPSELIADTVLAFELGLSTGAADVGEAPRATFDVLWLALLSLTE